MTDGRQRHSHDALPSLPPTDSGLGGPSRPGWTTGQLVLGPLGNRLALGRRSCNRSPFSFSAYGWPVNGTPVLTPGGTWVLPRRASIHAPPTCQAARGIWNSAACKAMQINSSARTSRRQPTRCQRAGDSARCVTKALYAANRAQVPQISWRTTVARQSMKDSAGVRGGECRCRVQVRLPTPDAHPRAGAGAGCRCGMQVRELVISISTLRPGLRPEGVALRAVRLTGRDEPGTVGGWLMTSPCGMGIC